MESDLMPGVKIVLKDFDYCQRELAEEGNPIEYDISLPEDMRKFFEIPVVTVKRINPYSGFRFRIEEDEDSWTYHPHWVKSLNILPDELFEI